MEKANNPHPEIAGRCNEFGCSVCGGPQDPPKETITVLKTALVIQLSDLKPGDAFIVLDPDSVLDDVFLFQECYSDARIIFYKAVRLTGNDRKTRGETFHFTPAATHYKALYSVVGSRNIRETINFWDE